MTRIIIYRLLLLLFVTCIPAYADGINWDALNNEVESLSRQSRHDRAIDVAKKALQTAEQAPEHDAAVLVTSLNNLSDHYYEYEQFECAEPLLKQALAIREKALGPDHPDVASSLHCLSELYRRKGQYAQGMPLSERALAIREKTFGPEHPDVAQSLSGFALLLQDKGLYAEAESLHKRSLAIREKVLGPEHLDVAQSLNNLALLFQNIGPYAQAEPLHKRALAIREKTLGPEHPDVAQSLTNLADLYNGQGRYVQAEQLYTRALAIRVKAFGQEHTFVASSLSGLALLYQNQSKYAQAEPLYKRSLAIREKALGPEHREVAVTLCNLANLYNDQGLYAQAESLYKRALAIREKALGPEHREVAENLVYLANLYNSQGQYAQAEPLYKSALGIMGKAPGPEHPDVAVCQGNLASLYCKQGQFAQAEQLYKQALVILEKTLGPEHHVVAVTLECLAILYAVQGQYVQAEPLFQRSLAILEKILGPNHPDLALCLGNYAQVNSRVGQYTQAMEYSRRNFQILRRRFENIAGSFEEQKFHRNDFAFFVSQISRRRDDTAIAESFEAYQLAQSSSVGQSVARLAARFAAQGGELASAIRAQQDLLEKLTHSEKALIEEMGKPPAKYNAIIADQLRKEIAGQEKTATERHLEIVNRFPEYDALVSPAPVTASTAQKFLREGEALVTYLVDQTNGCYAWVVSRDRTEIYHLNVSERQIVDLVAVLRAKLDPVENPKLFPFDATTSHELYQKIFAPLEPALSGIKHIIVIPDGALQSLPFAVLVDKQPKTKNQTSWLADRYAFSTVPSVAALRAIRAFTRPVSGDLPFAGFGDPVLEGKAIDMRAVAPRAISDESTSAGIRGNHGLANVNVIRQQDPLPESADELYKLAKTLNAPATSLFLREKATETMVKQMDLSRQRILAFATHGVMAGQMRGVAEPGLILTPPEKATELDDGYLTASEVAQLKLNADWVLLSACNTASPEAPGAEGLSGLAKAFFYAGARSLLVSHWHVVSDATVQIITEMLKIYTGNSGIGKAEALQLSMRKLRNNPQFSHPLFWAPFVVVGEGGAAPIAASL